MHPDPLLEKAMNGLLVQGAGPGLGSEVPYWSVLKAGNPGGNLLPVESVELDNSDLFAKRQRHHLHCLIASVQLDDQPAAMYASFAAPVHVRYEVRAKLLDRSKRFDSRVVLAFVG